MRRTTATAIATLVLLAAGALSARNAHAITACTAADIIAQRRRGGTLPGRQRSLQHRQGVRDRRRLHARLRDARRDHPRQRQDRRRTPTRSTSARGSFSIAPSGRVEGRGNLATPPRDRGGSDHHHDHGRRQHPAHGRDRGIIDVAGNVRGGTLIIIAGGSITVSGDIIANNLTADGGNGVISLRSGRRRHERLATAPSRRTGGDFSTRWLHRHHRRRARSISAPTSSPTAATAASSTSRPAPSRSSAA